ncbi:hypothetical protein Tco_0482822, partial [Tanacetum coccineum]
DIMLIAKSVDGLNIKVEKRQKALDVMSVGTRLSTKRWRFVSEPDPSTKGVFQMSGFGDP